MREGGAGITSYSVDKAATAAAFALSSRLFLADLLTGGARELPAAGAVVDPRLSPDGQQVAYAAQGALHVVSTHDGSSRTLAEPDGEDVTWGLAEFVASEELERYRGHWWLPDSSGLIVARVDEAPVGTWWVADPAHPATAPYPHRYPSAGTANADVTLWLVGLDGSRTELRWDRAAFPYLLQVEVDDERATLVQVSDRRQQHQQILSSTPTGVGGGTDAGADEAIDLVVLRELHDPAWLDVVPGVPQWWGDQLVTVEVADDTYRLCLDGTPLSPVGLQVRGVGAITDDGIVVSASSDGVERRLVLQRADGSLDELGPSGRPGDGHPGRRHHPPARRVAGDGRRHDHAQPVTAQRRSSSPRWPRTRASRPRRGWSPARTTTPAPSSSCRPAGPRPTVRCRSSCRRTAVRTTQPSSTAAGRSSSSSGSPTRASPWSSATGAAPRAARSGNARCAWTSPDRPSMDRCAGSRRRRRRTPRRST